MLSQRDIAHMRGKIEAAVKQFFDTQLPRLNVSDKKNSRVTVTFANQKLAIYLVSFPQKEMAESILDIITRDFDEDASAILHEDFIFAVDRFNPFQTATSRRSDRQQLLDVEPLAAAASFLPQQDYFEGNEPIILQALERSETSTITPGPVAIPTPSKSKKLDGPIYDYAASGNLDKLGKPKPPSPIYASLDFSEREESGQQEPLSRRSRRKSSGHYATLKFFPPTQSEIDKSNVSEGDYALPQDNVKSKARRLSDRGPDTSDTPRGQQLTANTTRHKLVRADAFRRKKDPKPSQLEEFEHKSDDDNSVEQVFRAE